MNFPEKFINYKNIFIQKYWSDPVWSKVISAIIIGIGTGIFIILKSFYESISIISAGQPIIKYFNSHIKLNNLVFWLGMFVICWSLFIFSKSVLGKFKKQGVNKVEPEELPTIYEFSTAFFFKPISWSFSRTKRIKVVQFKNCYRKIKNCI